MKNLLVLSAGRRVSLVKGFMDAALGLNAIDVKVYAADMAPQLSAACRISDGSFRLPRVSHESFARELLSLCQAHGIGLIVPTIDTELPVLSGLREQFLDEDIQILVSDAWLISQCADKRKTAVFFKERGLPTPELYARDSLRYPFLLKPYDGSLSAGVQLIEKPEDLTPGLLQNERNMFCEYIDHGTHHEFTVDMYYDRQHRLRCVVPRCRLEVRGGEVSKALTQKNEIVPTLFRQLGRLEGARGCLTLQLFRHKRSHDHSYIEINARFGGGYPLSRLSGADFQRWIICEYFLDEKVPEFHDWAENALMLRYDAEVLTFDYRPV